MNSRIAHFYALPDPLALNTNITAFGIDVLMSYVGLKSNKSSWRGNRTDSIFSVI